MAKTKRTIRAASHATVTAHTQKTRKRPVADHNTAFKALDQLEDALADAEGSAFLFDQFVTHGEHTDDTDRAFHHINRLVASDMEALRKAFSTAFGAILWPRGGKAKGGAA